jgi:acyl transferase domain-containing protein
MSGQYSRRTQARVALSVAAREVSDHARSLVPADDRGSGAGEIVERAAQLLDDVRGVLDRAVICEREQGASWQTIGAALGISRQTAHERFAEVERLWKDALRRPYA